MMVAVAIIRLVPRLYKEHVKAMSPSSALVVVDGPDAPMGGQRPPVVDVVSIHNVRTTLERLEGQIKALVEQAERRDRQDAEMFAVVTALGDRVALLEAGQEPKAEVV